MVEMLFILLQVIFLICPGTSNPSHSIAFNDDHFGDVHVGLGDRQVGNDANVLLLMLKSPKEQCHEQCEKAGEYEWSKWEPWGNCSVSCGGGIRTRDRWCCDEKGEETTSDNCPGDAIEEELCNPETCVTPVAWSLWDNWSSCSVSCGGGIMTRNRTCLNTDDQSVSDQCQGASGEQEVCNPETCIYPEWSAWSPYGPCNRECGTGNYSRARECHFNGSVVADDQCPSGDVSFEINNCNTVPCPACPSGNWTFGGSDLGCIQVMTGNDVNWWAAEEICRSMGSHLVEIFDNSSQAWVADYLKNNAPDGKYWMGINDLAKEDTYIYVGSNQPVVFTSWNSGEPNNAGNEDCTELNIAQNYVGWNDGSCTDTNVPLCWLPSLI